MKDTLSLVFKEIQLHKYDLNPAKFRGILMVMVTEAFVDRFPPRGTHLPVTWPHHETIHGSSASCVLLG